jgi:hypothetical protein
MKAFRLFRILIIISLFSSHHSLSGITNFDNSNSSDFSVELSNAETIDTFRLLFIGNSFTGRLSIHELVKEMVEDGNPNIIYIVEAETYGGRSLKDHWQLGSQNFIKQSTLTVEEQQAHIKSLEDMSPTDPLYEKYRSNALTRHRALLNQIGSSTLVKYDMVVLQSWNDDRLGDASEYMEYAPKFAEIIKDLGGHVVLYEKITNFPR